jgi:hypothetical protein
MRIPEQDIGGARVRMGFTIAGVFVKAGTMLSRDEVLGIRNRNALEDVGKLEIFPRAPQPEMLDRMIVGVGKDKFNVIEGRVINPEPLSRQEADKLLREGQTSH